MSHPASDRVAIRHSPGSSSPTPIPSRIDRNSRGRDRTTRTQRRSGLRLFSGTVIGGVLPFLPTPACRVRWAQKCYAAIIPQPCDMRAISRGANHVPVRTAPAGLSMSTTPPQTSSPSRLSRVLRLLIVVLLFLLLLPYALTPLYRVVDPVSTLM